jgi:hypothetical protein
VKRRSPKNVLRLPDLDHSKAAVLQSLGSTASKRTYAFAISKGPAVCLLSNCLNREQAGSGTFVAAAAAARSYAT